MVFWAFFLSKYMLMNVFLKLPVAGQSLKSFQYASMPSPLPCSLFLHNFAISMTLGRLVSRLHQRGLRDTYFGLVWSGMKQQDACTEFFQYRAQAGGPPLRTRRVHDRKSAQYTNCCRISFAQSLTHTTPPHPTLSSSRDLPRTAAYRSIAAVYSSCGNVASKVQG